MRKLCVSFSNIFIYLGVKFCNNYWLSTTENNCKLPCSAGDKRISDYRRLEVLRKWLNSLGSV